MSLWARCLVRICVSLLYIRIFIAVLIIALIKPDVNDRSQVNTTTASLASEVNVSSPDQVKFVHRDLYA
ncbi:hypothetical protein XELAEV_18046963mg [Xenopus laevis]|uniref:Uncharacterized protein n=1 Tax=Xenopus laevis TaxID=8355 RepID=A0A974BTY6_XENLA|nr:hypothetical protein XELAEV_18046963mg [Xenopus laevis]